MAAPIILCDTAGMTRERWLECREHGPKGDIEYTVGGSDVATIFGLSPWCSPLELWLIKKGRMKPTVKANANQLEMGHLLEPIAAHWYEKKTGNTVINDTNMYQHADHPYALADFDRRFIRASDGEPGILECKSLTFHKADEWADDGYPPHYEMQLRYYLAVADVKIGAFSALWGNNPDSDLAMPSIERDTATEDIIFQKLDQWIWSLRNDKPPTMQDVKPKTALESLARIYQKSDPSLPTIELPVKHEKALRRIAELQGNCSEYEAKKKRAEKEIEALSVKIVELMKTHAHGVLESTKDKLLIDYVTKTQRRASVDYIKTTYPQIYEESRRPSTSRKLKVKVQPK